MAAQSIDKFVFEERGAGMAFQRTAAAAYT